jgi:hypothetical protein
MDYPGLATNVVDPAVHVGMDLGLSHVVHPSRDGLPAGHGSMTELLLGDDPVLPQLSQVRHMGPLML